MTVGPEIHRDAASQEVAHIDTMIGPHLRLTRENIELRTRLDLMRKSKEAAQELLEAERQANARLSESRAILRNSAKGLSEIARAYEDDLKATKAALDTEKLLRVNDAATIADLERRLREAESQLKAQRLSAAEVSEIRAYVPWATKKERARADAAAAENAEIVELRRTISLMAKTAAEVQDNFRLIAELAADPADEAHKEPKP